MEYVQTKSDFAIRKELMNPTDAADLMKELIDDKINFYKLKRLSDWIGDHHGNHDFYSERINSLFALLNATMDKINTAKDQNKKLEITASYEIRIV